MLILLFGWLDRYAELSKEEKSTISHRFRAIEKMIEHFKEWINKLIDFSFCACVFVLYDRDIQILNEILNL